MISKFFSAFSGQRDEDRRVQATRDLIRREAQIGGQLFGAVPKGGRREFFCLDRQTWIWHEEWIDNQGVHHIVTTRFDVRPHGIFKAQDGQPYQPLSQAEAIRFRDAVRMYGYLLRQDLYSGVAV